METSGVQEALQAGLERSISRRASALSSIKRAQRDLAGALEDFEMYDRNVKEFQEELNG